MGRLLCDWCVDSTGCGQVRSVIVDFMDDDLEGGLAKIAQATSDIQVGILVNNVGISYPYARFLHEVDAVLEKSLLRLNCETTTKMIHLFLPSMLKRKRGAIINVGSGAVGILPSYPLYAVYAASKGYVSLASFPPLEDCESRCRTDFRMWL